ncbi:hypothetical protein QFC19_001835 [Naganishia cerealis]|uniref:Uncharacterized protein n=1 Tax=Naganishia cerealis TaxID=610337 RepID=A0ACC2WG91_9TREE|nr:hypothetical protein QFC19_001835 [Naganishia cerealis]
MDFSMASFTSPSQPSFPHQPGHASRQHVAATDTRFPDPPTIESIQREVAYWRRSQTSQPSPQDNLSSSQPTALHATYMTPEARGSLPSRGGASSASSVGGSMDISAQSFEEIADEPSSAVDNRIEEQHELELERNEEHTREDVPAGFEAGEGEDEAEEEEQRDEQEGDESNASSTHHLRDDQLEVLILENLGFHGNLTRRGEMVLLEESYYSETGTDSDDSQTRLESDSDELAIQLTRDGHAVVASHDAASAEDQAPSVIRVKKRRRVPGTTRNKTRGKKRGEEFNVEKRRRQWLSEKEDRALRRGPLMAVSEAEFKETNNLAIALTGRTESDMLDASEWKQLINHELSTTAWKYMPVVGPGFLPSANLAALGQSSAHVRPMPLSSIPSGPLHSTQHRSRNVNMAVLAASHEAIAYGQAGEEYGIRALPLALHYHEQQSEGTLEFSGRGRDDRRDTSGDRDTDSESDTEMAEDSLEKIVGPGHPTAKHTNTYLEGSFGRLAVHDPQRAMMLVEDSGHM